MGPEIILQHVSGSTMAGREQRFAKSKVVIGRHPDCDAAFDSHRDLSVSSRHAELYTVGNDLFIKDLNSRNGTYVNSDRINQPVKITSSDVLSFGYDGPSAHAFLSPSQDEKKMQSPRPSPPGQSTINRLVADAVGRQSGRQGAAALAIVGLLAFCVGTFTGYLALPKFLVAKNSEGAETTTEPVVNTSTTVSALGRLEPDGGLRNVSSTPGEIIDQMLVEEGDEVAKDQELAYLQSKRLLEVELAYAEAALADAVAQADAATKYGDALVREAAFGIAQANKPLDLEIEALNNQIKVLEKNVELAKDDTRRLVDLGDKAPGEQLARQRLVQKAAELELESVRSRLTTLQTTIQLRRDQARSQSETALANSKRLETSVAVKSAEKNIERVKAKLNLATIRAPQDGRVLKVFVHAGEAVGPKPVLQLADTEKVYVNAEVYESDLRRVKVGQKATIENAALPQAFHGVVEKVLWTVSQDGLRSIDPTAPSDLRVVPVKVRINDDEVATHRELLTRLINLQVDVYIEVGDDS